MKRMIICLIGYFCVFVPGMCLAQYDVDFDEIESYGPDWVLVNGEIVPADYYSGEIQVYYVTDNGICSLGLAPKSIANKKILGKWLSKYPDYNARCIFWWGYCDGDPIPNDSNSSEYDCNWIDEDFLVDQELVLATDLTTTKTIYKGQITGYGGYFDNDDEE